jgi:hypothetical protein
MLSVHLVLSERSRGLVDAEALGWMKPRRAWSIRRGGRSSMRRLIKALQKRRLAGAALDVFDIEPLPLDHPFRRLPNVLATPHVGYVSEQNYQQFLSADDRGYSGVDRRRAHSRAWLAHQTRATAPFPPPDTAPCRSELAREIPKTPRSPCSQRFVGTFASKLAPTCSMVHKVTSFLSYKIPI